MKFIITIETEVEIKSIEDEFEAKVCAIRLVQDQINGSPANKFKFRVIDAEVL